jgi:pyrroloquinoline quinone (PQQ) biosynthesis protein C
MIPASLAHALNYFETKAPIECNGGISREAIMAYATLRAIEHYYPEMLEEPMKRLLEEYAWIKAQEPARAIKQKRIMSWIISRELNGCNE